MSEHIRILGAGPAGLTAAINLSKAGYSVEVYERQSDVGVRFHNDIEGLENWSKKIDVLKEFSEMNLDINFDHAPVTSLIGVAPDSKQYEIKTSKTMMHLVRRGAMGGTLDHGLKEQALSYGVRIRFNQHMNKRDADIIATGHVHGRIAAIAKGITFNTSHPPANLVIFDDDLAYKGYSYLFIVDGHGTLATVLFSRFGEIGAQFKLAISKIMNVSGLENIYDVKPFGGVGHFSNSCAFSNNGRVYIGEAAGLQDLLWGFGMRTAVVSGYLAAKAIIEGEDYSVRAKEHFEDYLRNGIVNRYLFSMLGNQLYPYLIKVLSSVDKPEAVMKEVYTYRFYKKCLYPITKRFVKQSYPWLV
ncbi:MAG: NAD(P)/FAD-dependent oxidoreductase [Euryarchaeota archaeon]|nr:NAD(P)/FAD-dependent oxidoreductase [Euryarchaeota archaeon]